MEQTYLFLACGTLVGLFLGSLLFKSRSAEIRGRFDGLKEEHQKLAAELAKEKESVLKFATENSTLKEKQRGTEEKLKDLNEVKNQLTREFENLAGKIFQEKMSSFQKESTSNMDTVLKPFKEKLSEFQSTVTRYREDEMKESATLKNEIGTMVKLNQKLSLDAENLTKALKGDNKLQGNWGEFILKKVLESSGLREGEEYTLQGKDLSLKNSEGDFQRPDAIVNLPDNKHIIIDSKVSLIGYDRFIAAENQTLREIGAKDFITSLKTHIKQLSEKKYQSLDKLITPDFVLLFVPIEGAFATALQTEPELFQFGWDKKIILVSPTTLMVTLRTIESIWKQEKQNKNAFQIAKLAGELYDKFGGFVDDIQSLKVSLERSTKNVDDALTKLSTGRGNVLSKFEKMKELGAQASKTINLTSNEDQEQVLVRGIDS